MPSVSTTLANFIQLTKTNSLTIWVIRTKTKLGNFYITATLFYFEIAHNCDIRLFLLEV